MVEQYGIDADTLEYALIGSSGVKETINSFSVPGFSIPVRAIFDESANILALRDLLKS